MYYLKKLIETDSGDNAEAWIIQTVKIDLASGRLALMLGGWENIESFKSGKGQVPSAKNILHFNIDMLESFNEFWQEATEKCVVTDSFILSGINRHTDDNQTYVYKEVKTSGDISTAAWLYSNITISMIKDNITFFFNGYTSEQTLKDKPQHPVTNSQMYHAVSKDLSEMDGYLYLLSELLQTIVLDDECIIDGATISEYEPN